MMPNQRVASPAPGPVKTSTSVLIVLFGLWLVAGADPSVATKEGLTAASFARSPEVKKLLMQTSEER